MNPIPRLLLAVLLPGPLASLLGAQGPGPPAADAARPAQPQAPAATSAPAPPKPATMKGRVIDFHGAPLTGVAVRFSADRNLLTADVLREPTVRTGDDGRFELTAEPPDPKWSRATLHLVHKGHAGASLPAAPAHDREKKEYATERDFGDVILLPGTRLFGRVRDAEGKPLPGARIVARDMFDQGRLFRGRPSYLFCAAASDASGIFDLPCALSQAVRIEAVLDGHFLHVVQPVAAGTPLEITLRLGGQVSGRVLDPDGRGVEGATVSAAYEVRSAMEFVTTGSDGSFRIALQRPTRYRLRVTQQRESVAWTGKSEVLEGPRDNLELYLAPPDKQPGGPLGEVAVRAIDKKTGQVVARFRAASVWEQYANQNANYLEHRVRMAIRAGPQAESGTVAVAGPVAGAPTTGAVRVQAEGYAPATLREVEWQELEQGKERPALVAELVPQSVLSGRVLDEQTGAPVAGAKVWARPQQNRAMGYYNEGTDAPPEAVTTAADGSYGIGMLAEGGHELFVRHPERPVVPPVDVELRAEEERGGFDLKLPAGAPVSGKLAGGGLGRGWKVFLQELPEFTPGGGGYSRVYYGNNEPPGAIEVGADGAFAFQGAKLADYRLVLMVPSPPRCGSHVYVPLEPFRLRRGGFEREFDVAQDRPGRVRGRVAFRAAAVPFERVVVAARPVPADRQNVFFNPLQNDWSGPRAFVDRGGAFEMVLGPGRYALEAVDLATGIRLGTTGDAVSVAAGGTAECALEPELVELSVRLEAEREGAMAPVDRLETRVLPKDLKDQARMFGGNDNYDMGVGVDLEPGQSELRLLVPPADVTLFVRSSFAALCDDQQKAMGPLLRQEFEASAQPGAAREIVLKVPPPPELPAAADKPAAEDKDALGKPK